MCLLNEKFIIRIIKIREIGDSYSYGFHVVCEIMSLWITTLSDFSWCLEEINIHLLVAKL